MATKKTEVQETPAADNNAAESTENAAQDAKANDKTKTNDDAAEISTGAADPDGTETTETTVAKVKSGFQRIPIRAVCDDGQPFAGSYRSLVFDGNGCATVTDADAESLENLQREFPTLVIKQA